MSSQATIQQLPSCEANKDPPLDIGYTANNSVSGYIGAEGRGSAQVTVSAI